MSEFGFTWPAGESGGSRVVVERLTEIRHGRGRYRVIRVATDREELELTVTPSGMVRIHRGKEELLTKRRLTAILMRAWKSATEEYTPPPFIKPCDCETCQAHREVARA